MSFKFKGGGIPKEFRQYYPNNALNQPSVAGYLNPSLKNMWKTLQQPDLTRYTQENGGGKK
jgi:hypothetical protein